MKKRFLFLLLAVFFVLSGLFYAKDIYLPAKLKALALEFSQKHWGLNLKIADVALGWGGKVTLKKVEANYKGQEVFSLPLLQVRFNLPKLLQRQVFLSYLRIKQPKVFILPPDEFAALKKEIKSQSKISSASKVSSVHLPQKGKRKKKFFLRRLILQKAQIFWQKARFCLDLDGIFSQDYKLSARANIEADEIRSFLQMEADLEKKQAKAQGKVQSLDLDRIFALFHMHPSYKIRLPEFSSFNYEISLTPGLLQAKAKIGKAKFVFNSFFKLSGFCQIEGVWQYSFLKKQPSFSASAQLKEAEAFLPQLQKPIENLAAGFYLSQNKLEVYSLSGKIGSRSFSGKGEIVGFGRPEVSARGIFDLDLSLLKEVRILPLKALGVQGPAQINFEFKGDLKRPKLENLAASVLFKKDKLLLPKNSFSQITGKANLQSGRIIWQNLKFFWQKTAFTSSGLVEDIKRPHAVFSLAGGKLYLDAAFFWDKNKKLIKELILKGSFGKNSSFNVKADLDIAKQLFLKGQGIASVDLGDAVFFFKSQKLRKYLNLQGNANLEFSFKGSLKDSSFLKGEAMFSAKEIAVHALKLNHVKALCAFKNNTFILSPLEADFYQGNLQLRAKYNLLKRSFVSNFKVSGADIGLLALDLGKKPDEYSGELALDIDTESSDLKDLDKLKSEGRIEVKDGNIWKMDLFAGIKKLIPLNKKQEIVFRDGWANFYLAKKIIKLEGLSLASSLLEIKSKGTISLGGNLNLLVFMNISPPLIRNAPALNKLASLLLDNGLITVEVKGNIKKPTYHLLPFFLKANPVEKMKGLVGEMLKIFNN